MRIPQSFEKPSGPSGKIDNLIHEYVDGALNRRDLVRSLARLTGGTAAALALLETEGLAQVKQQSCPADIKVAENDKSVQWQDVTFPGDGVELMGHLAHPAGMSGAQPAIIVIHENRGLTDHIRDVTRRAAKAGFVALGIDLLSRQGGSRRFPDDAQKAAAYQKTVPGERLKDILSAIEHLNKQSNVEKDHIGAVGFCAGGGNIMNAVLNGAGLRAAVPFYGGLPQAPLPAAENVRTAMCCVFSEKDTAQAARIPELTGVLVAAKVDFDIRLYKGTAHGFHNDTSPIYDAAAACDAWQRAMAWFNTHLRG